MSTVMRPPADRRLTLLVTVAHPDDESFGCGSVIAAAAEAGWRVVVCCASRGEAGEDASGLYAEPGLLGVAREAELHAAASALGVEVVEVLGFADSGWSGPAPAHSLVEDLPTLVDEVSRMIQAHRPDVVVTMDPSGSDGHRDHAAATATMPRLVPRPRRRSSRPSTGLLAYTTGSCHAH
ncbi:PIG-L deacetylase family protein [Arthrobacter sp. H14-L1]|uniref:PIG-L deacetylase family protein n=1 Tax=Arthrobacter sp. H14-L1 TaxID=2996697 RepID=UPI002271443C|nr:PIG-L family deacetylase [Arthrobacter sp. H14-L1]MCY0903814.1 PIG-L family deacetylase [Arthrobacter sp. H14-L1]